MIRAVEFSVADPDFYLPPGEATHGRAYEIGQDLPGWRRSVQGAWTVWETPTGRPTSEGWKVHVAARPDRAEAVLRTVADVCGRHDVAFKHLRTDWVFRWLHHKHGDRVQSGKFCTAYPSSVLAAEALMQDLAQSLADEDGPRPLTDRAFGGSRVVSYRYGAFVDKRCLRADGTSIHQVVDGHGHEVEDLRGPGFSLPEAIHDPFLREPQAVAAEVLRLGRYRFTGIITTANGGGTYAGITDTGRPVFVKQARPHNGYQWDGTSAQERLRHEHEVLVALHAACPGLAPEPLDLLHVDHHDYLVTEFVPGRTLWAWNAMASPLAETDLRAEALAAHYERCRRLLDRLAAELDRLHDAGYVFIDLNPANVLVDDVDRPRLVDFEAAARIGGVFTAQGAPGYLSPAALRADTRPTDARELDAYALSALAQLLIHPSHAVLDRSPDTLAHLRSEVPFVPEDLWRRAARFRPTTITGQLPTPDEVEEDPSHWLGWLRDRTAAGLLHQLDPASQRPVRTVPEGLVVHPAGLAYGTAGIVHVLGQCQLPVDARLVDALSLAVRADDADLVPGLMTGRAGIAWVLADMGRTDAALRALLELADHPLLDDTLNLSDGRAGVALAALHVDAVAPDDRLVELAFRLLGPATDGALLADLPSGWRHGAAGVALALQRLAERSDDRTLYAAARHALRADLRHLRPVGNGGALFHVSDRDRRVEPYLASGSAGFALVAAQLLSCGETGPDPELESAWRASLVAVRSGLMTLLPSLFEGLAGLGLTLVETGPGRPDLGLAGEAQRLARGLFKHSVPGPRGTVRFLGGIGGRFSDDLAYGSAGILLFLDQLLTGRTGGLPTLDAIPAGHRKQHVTSIPPCR